jgi:tetratricopeptide (TPR) repeat protein
MLDPSARRRLAWTLMPPLFAAAVFCAYWPVLHAGFIWDDDRIIQTNPLLANAEGLWRLWFDIGAIGQYYPLAFSTFWFEFHAFGMNPLWFHLDNLLLHLCSVIILWRVLLRLKIPGAWAAALLFAVHPMQVESVGWVSERKNCMSGVFYLLAFWAYLHTSWGQRIVEQGHDQDRPQWGWYAASLILFACALLSKTVTATLPAAILLLVWWRYGRIGRRDIWPVAPMFAAAAALGSLTRWMERDIVGAVGADFDWITPLDRFCIAGRDLWFYLCKLAWPARLTFIYPRWQMDASTRPWLVLFPIAALAALAGLWLIRRRCGRGPLTAMLFFAGTLFPALGFANVYPMQYSFVADHFQYLACVGPFVLVAAVVWRYLPRAAGAIILTALIAGLGTLAHARALDYHDAKTLWLDTLAKNPNSAMAHGNLGQILMDENNVDGAEAEFRKAVELHPVETGNRINIGYCYALRGDWAQAQHWYSEALANMPDSRVPAVHRRRAEPNYRLGTAYLALAQQAQAAGQTNVAEHDRQLALQHFQTAVDIYPEYDLARNYLGMLLAQQGKLDDAILQFRAALQANPRSIFAMEQLGNALEAQGQPDAAMEEYRQMLQIEPNNVRAMNDIGTLLWHQGKLDDAIAMFQTAIKIDPASKTLQRNLDAVMAQKQAGTP